MAAPRVIEGTLNGSGLRLAIVVGRFNELITRSLLEGALSSARRHGVRDGDVEIAHVPGAYEIPLVARRMARTKRFDAVIALGAVIRGATAHFDYVAGQAASGIAQAAWECDLPVVFGVLTTDTIEQAVERAGTKAGNKGAEACEVAIETAQLLRAIDGESS